MDIPTPILALCAAGFSMTQYLLPARQLWSATILPADLLEPALLTSAFNTLVWIAYGIKRPHGGLAVIANNGVGFIFSAVAVVLFANVRRDEAMWKGKGLAGSRAASLTLLFQPTRKITDCGAERRRSSSSACGGSSRRVVSNG